MYFVYVLLDPRKPGKYRYGRFSFDFEPFYVGKGHGNRPEQHVDEAVKSERKSHKLNKLRSILRTGMYPEVAYPYRLLPENLAFEMEKFLIALIGRSDYAAGPLTNATDGGDGLRNPSKQLRRKMSKRSKEYWETADREEHGAKVSAGYSSMSDERYQSMQLAMSTGQKRRIASRTPKQRAAESAKHSASARAMWENRSEETYESMCAKRREHMNRPENKYALAERAANLTPQQEAARRKKLSAGAKAQWERMTDTERAALSAKRSQAQKLRRQREAEARQNA